MSEIERHLHAGHPVFRVTALEEDEAAHAVVEAVRARLGAATRVHGWDAAAAAPAGPDGGGPGAALVELLDRAGADAGPALYLLRDLEPFLERPEIARRVRRLPGAIGTRPVRVVLLGPRGELRPELAHDVPTAAFTLPGFAAMLRIVDEEAAGRVGGGVSPRVVASALRGLTALEARLLVRRVLATGDIDELALTRLFEEKARRVEGATLEFFPPDLSFAEVGGLRALKDWVERRAAAFRGELAASAAPRGLLLMGVSGCGKSLAVKALSRALAAPLFRLDLARVFARRDPELAFTTSLAAVEAMAPCILWIDEIENALALGAQDSGSSARISGSFLTWLQERPDGVFVAATANRIELLPAELLRRGRFDQIFFVDLPDEEDRKEIWGVHLRRCGLDPDRFDLIVLARSTAGWTGAEIGAAVDAALLDARHRGADAPDRDELFRAIGRTVPLSVTMKEQIRRIRDWAHDRARGASGTG